MSKADTVFNFSDAYRELQPTAERAVVTAREATHKKLCAESNSIERIVDMVHLAFGLPGSDSSSFDWLEQAAKEQDPQFSLSIDAREARIVATLVLRSFIASELDGTPALVLAGSLAGRRPTVDDGRIVSEARSALARKGRLRGYPFDQQVATTRWGDVSKAVAAAKADVAASPAAVEALAAEAKAANGRLVADFNGALKMLTNENRRLAEEVDLLWWHIGARSYLLDRPLSAINERALPLVVGSDVAAMINVLPGPHGALGLLRQAVGAADDKQSIKATLEAVGGEDRALLLQDVPTGIPAVASLNFGLTLLNDESMASAASSMFAKRTKVAMTAQLTRFEIAVQAFYERAFIKAGWLG